jgi:hypothetical protein
MKRTVVEVPVPESVDAASVTDSSVVEVDVNPASVDAAQEKETEMIESLKQQLLSKTKERKDEKAQNKLLYETVDIFLTLLYFFQSL